MTLVLLFYIYIDGTKNVTTFINIVSRQRMLSQEMLSLAEMIKNGQIEDKKILKKVMGSFEQNLGIIDVNGMAIKSNYLYPVTNDVVNKLDVLNKYWLVVKPSLFLIANKSFHDEEFRNAVKVVKSNINYITQASDDVILAYDVAIMQLGRIMLVALLLAAIIGIASILISIWLVSRFTKERNEVEHQLVTSQNRFALAVNGANDGIWDWDLITGEMFLSDRWKQMLSYEPDEIENTFSAWHDLIHPDDLGRFLVSWAEYMDGLTPQFFMEYRLRTKDNNYKWILCRGTSSSVEGESLKLSGSHTDINQQKIQEQQLKHEKNEQLLLINKLHEAQQNIARNEETLRLSQVFSKVGNWLWDLESNQVTWSELTYSLFGLEQGKDEESYENFIHCIHPDDRDAVLHAIENCIKNHKGYDIEHRVIWNDGSEHWLHERGNVVRDENGNALRMMGLIHDITETKRNEKYLNKLINQSSSLNDQLLQEHSVRKASEKKLSNILDIAPVAIIVINEHQKITVFNKGAEKIFHYSANELINHPLSALIPDSLPDEVDNQASSLYQVSAFKSLEGKVEVLGRRKDGTEFPCGLNISVIKENDEWFCTVILRDLTGQKKAEQALLKEKREQEELIKKLQDAQDQLLQSEKMASIGQLAAGVAHEINNPVGYINSNIGSLKNYLADLLSLLECYENSEEKIQDLELLQSIQKMKKDVDLEYLKTDIRDLINESEEGVTRVKKIVQDLKDFSHVDEAEWQWTDLHNGLDSTLNIVHNELKYKAEVIKEYGDIPQIECIISQLNQVFMNLLVNAAHAIETRGTITVRTGTEDDGVWVEIEDTGKGMDETTRKRIFDPFFTTKPVGQGTGLGLSLSFGIIQKHSGKIIVTSEPGKGSCFHIWLPVQKSENSEELIQ